MPADWVLIIDKPPGITSRQAAARAAELTGAAKAGHAGTLDPLATGVLVVCLGRATLLSSYLGAGTKEYQVEALLGTSTDTYDIDGKVVSRRDASGVTAAEVERALEGFVGEHEQVPPPFSAVKHGGRALYQYARKGVEIPRIERTVVIDSATLVGLSLGEEGLIARIHIVCGPGTYVRSVVYDLGEKLGCGACVASLVRTVSGVFTLADSVTLDELERLGPALAASRAISIEDATRGMPSVPVSGELATAIAMGKPLAAGAAVVPADGVFRVLDGRGKLIALYGPARSDDEGIAARAVRVLRPHGEGNDGEAA